MVGFGIHSHESAMGVHVFPPWTPLLPPSHPMPQGHPSAPALGTLSHASNLDWWFISRMIKYTFQCHSPKSSHPHPLPQSSKDCSIHLCLLPSHIQGYCCHLSKFHIYALVYCIGVFLSGLLHSVWQTAKETQMYRTVFWTLWERARVRWFGRMASKHV